MEETNKKAGTGTINCMVVSLVICIIAEAIGPLKFSVMGIEVKIMTMIWAILLGILLSPHLLGKVIPAIKKLIGQREIERAPFLLSLVLYPLGIMFGISAGPKIGVVFESGLALVLQEFGNLGTMFIALPLALFIGLGRSSVGSTFSLCRDTALGIIGDKYGLQSSEGIGTLGTYISGSVFGTLFYSFLAPVSLMIGFHPFALAMASGMGSASMMQAATAALVNAAPQFEEEILAYSATSGLLTSVTGVYMELFVALPLANFLYKKLHKPIENLRVKVFGKKAEEESSTQERG